MLLKIPCPHTVLCQIEVTVCITYLSQQTFSFLYFKAIHTLKQGRTAALFPFCANPQRNKMYF